MPRMAGRNLIPAPPSVSVSRRGASRGGPRSVTSRAVHPLGLHLLLDVAGAPFATLDDPVLVERALVDAATEMGAKVLGIHVHRLAPQGISGVVVISESHLTIHTWPERGEAAIDLFTCGDADRARAAVKGLLAHLGAGRSRLLEIARGAAPD